MKSRTKPFTSRDSAESFAERVGGKITTQSVNHSRDVHHVHYKSDGTYRGTNRNQETDYDFDGYTHDSSDI